MFTQSDRTRSGAWPLWPLWALLFVLSLGPPLAALFAATRLPLIADAGYLARDVLAAYVCPTPAQSYLLAGSPMAVCARCWGATLGLWLAWWGVWRGWLGSIWRRYRALHWSARMALSAASFLLWVAEIHHWPGVWPGGASPYAGTLLNGIQAGIFAGLFLYSIWPGLTAAVRPARGSVMVINL